MKGSPGVTCRLTVTESLVRDGNRNQGSRRGNPESTVEYITHQVASVFLTWTRVPNRDNFGDGGRQGSVRHLEDPLNGEFTDLQEEWDLGVPLRCLKYPHLYLH